MSDRTVRAIITADSAGAVRGFEEAGLAAETSGRKMGDSMEGATSRIGGIFQKLGTKLGSWGIPFSESVSKMGEKISEAETKGKGFSTAMAEVGKAVSLGAAAGIGVAAVESFHLADAFQQTSASLQAHAGISAAAAKQVGTAFLSTAGDTTFSAQQMMTAFAPISGQFKTMYGHALSSGQSLTFMKAAMDAAEASGSSLTTTAKSLADAMMVYHLKVGQAKTASDAMWNASKSLGVGIDTLGQSLARLEPRIAGSGMSLQQTGAFMVELAKEAGGGRQAMRLAGTAIQSLVTPSSSAQTVLAQMGVQLTNSHGKFVGMTSALSQLHGALAKLPGTSQSFAAAQQMAADQTQLASLKAESNQKAVKGQETALTGQIAQLKNQAAQLSQSSVMQSLFGRNANLVAGIVAGGTTAFDKATKAISQQGTATKAAETRAATFHGEMEKIKVAGEDLGVKFGQLLIPVVTKLTTEIAKGVTWLMHNKAAAIALAVVIGGALAVAVGAFAVNKVAGMVKSVHGAIESFSKFGSKIGEFVGNLVSRFTTAAPEVEASSEEMGAATETAFGPIGIAIMAVITIATLLVTHWKQVEGALKAVWHAIEGAAKVVWNALKAFFHMIWNAIKTVFEDTTLIGLILSHWTQIKADAIRAWDDIVAFFTGIPGKIVNALSALGSDIESVATSAMNGFLSAVSSAWNAVSSFFSSIPGKILSALGNAGSWLLGIGADIIHGLENGIRNAASGAISAVKNVGHDILGAVKGIFSIFSPSRVMHQMGAFIIQGLAQGITGTSSQAVGAMAAVANQMRTVPFTPPSVTVAGAVGGASTPRAIQQAIFERDQQKLNARRQAAGLPPVTTPAPAAPGGTAPAPLLASSTGTPATSGGGSVVNNITVYATTNASAPDIANDVGWALRNHQP